MQVGEAAEGVDEDVTQGGHPGLQEGARDHSQVLVMSRMSNLQHLPRQLDR
jgi:hypothetical protein